MTSASRHIPKGFALPMTVIAVAGLTLLLVGLLTVLSLERKTARSYSDAARADLAVESGLAVAVASLMEIACRDDSLVFRIEDPLEPTLPADDRPLGFREQFFTYGAVFENGAWRGIPLFSGETETTLGADRINAQNLSSALSTYVAEAEVIGTTTEHDASIPRAKWVDVPSSDPDGYAMRYAFWIDDLGGRIDGKTAGTIPRGDGKSPAEINYATILDPQSDNPALTPQLIAARGNLRTSASLRTVFGNPSAEAKLLEPHIHFYDTLPSPPPPKLIPHGFGYADAGQPAPDLNTFVTEKNVNGIAGHIAKQLPSFEARKGGFPAGEDYLKTLAASIIDYADTDSDATVGPGYRGVDSYPFVNELFDRYEWVSSPSGTVSIDVDTYIELWNPSDRPITGTFIFININKRKIKLGGNGTKDFSTATFGPMATSIPPNGFRVVPLGRRNYTFDVDLEPAAPLTFNEDDSESLFQLLWNGTLVDSPRGGVERTYSFLRPGLSHRQWKGNSSPPLDLSLSQRGDPRASYYIDDYFRKSDYGDNSNWGGRAIKRNLAKHLPYREARLEKWPDRGSNSTLGIAAGTDARIPTETQIILKSSGAPIANKEYPPNQPELAPSRISNAGSYSSLGELGHIFDPAQWHEVDKDTHSPSPLSGGGITLAIGRPEYAAFDKEGLRAAQLIDLFSLPETAPRATRVNINTAPREVLRTLIAAVDLDADPVATDLKIAKRAADPMIGDIFADHVIAHRNIFPLRSLSDLNLIREKPLTARDHTSPEGHPFFGNPAHYLNVPTVPERPDPNQEYNQENHEEWNDAGREELFRKVMGLVTCRSNLFRVVVAGEVMDASGKTVSRSTREYHIGVFPERDPEGKIIPTGTPIFQKFYETTR